jgi:hypothetical protein
LFNFLFNKSSVIDRFATLSVCVVYVFLQHLLHGEFALIVAACDGLIAQSSDASLSQTSLPAVANREKGFHK